MRVAVFKEGPGTEAGLTKWIERERENEGEKGV